MQVLSNFVKSSKRLSETHQIWLNHVTPGANFGNL